MSRRRSRAGGLFSWWLGEWEPAPKAKRSSPARASSSHGSSSAPLELGFGAATRKASRRRAPSIKTTPVDARNRAQRGDMTLAEAIGLGWIETSESRAKGKRR